MNRPSNGTMVWWRFTEVVWEIIQAKHWLRAQARRRHPEPFSKTTRGRLRRAARKFVIHQEHTVRG